MSSILLKVKRQSELLLLIFKDYLNAFVIWFACFQSLMQIVDSKSFSQPGLQMKSSTESMKISKNNKVFIPVQACVKKIEGFMYVEMQFVKVS